MDGTGERPEGRPQRDTAPPPPVSRNAAFASEPQRYGNAPRVASGNAEVGRDRDPAAADAVIARVATVQRGAVTWTQLTHAGVDPSAIRRRAKNGSLHRVHPGVYMVGHLALAPLAAETAALLACGDASLITHWSSLSMMRLIEHPPDLVHVTVVGRRCRPKRGIWLHTVSELDPWDIRYHEGIPLTSPARTLIDIAATASAGVLERAVSEARATRQLLDGELEQALERAGRRPGVGAMRAFLENERWWSRSTATASTATGPRSNATAARA